jgi:hypothetical protein
MLNLNLTYQYNRNVRVASLEFLHIGCQSQSVLIESRPNTRVHELGEFQQLQQLCVQSQGQSVESASGSNPTGHLVEFFTFRNEVRQFGEERRDLVLS